MKEKRFDKSTFFGQAIEVYPRDLADIQTCLVLAPHADDESLGCGGLIALLRRQDTDVSVVVMTDGSQSHPNSRKFSPESVKIIREKEALDALILLGVAENNVTFLRGKDSSLPAKNQAAFKTMMLRLSTIIKQSKPQLILVPYELDPHCDHRVTWQLLDEALKSHGEVKVWEYPIWLYELAKEEDIPHLKLNELKKVNIEEVLSIKVRAIKSHVSQTTKMIDDDPTGFILTDEVIAHFTEKFEYYIEKR